MSAPSRTVPGQRFDTPRVDAVLDVPPDTLKVSRELWLGMTAKRFMAWGEFDKFITAILPAKDLRAVIRVGGLAGADDEYKALVLERAIQERLDAARKAKTGSAAAGSPPCGAATPEDRR